MNQSDQGTSKNQSGFPFVEVKGVSERYSSEQYITQLYEELEKQRVMIIVCESPFDSHQLATHLASKSIEHFPPSNDDDDVNTSIPTYKNWIRDSDLAINNLINEMKSLDSSVIYLQALQITDIYDKFTNLLEAATQFEHKHLVIISTSTSQNIESWKTVDNQHVITPSTNQIKEIFTVEILNDVLEAELLEKELEFSGEAKQHLTKIFETPQQIRIFVEHLPTKAPLTNAGIQNAINIAKEPFSPKNELTNWFEKLDNQGQIVAIGMLLLEGVEENQFFDAFQLLVNNRWGQRFKELFTLDHFDLQDHTEAYKLSNNQLTASILSSSEQRTIMMEIIWKTHRRHIFHAMPVLTKMADDAFNNSVNHPNIYGTIALRRKLRAVLVDVFKNISILAENHKTFTTVEPYFATLAANDNLAVQRIIADSLSQWVFDGKTKQLLQTLKTWLYQNSLKQLIANYIRSTGRTTNIQSSESLKGTIVTTAAAAMRKDLPNEVFADYLELIYQCVKEQFQHKNFTLSIIFSISDLLLAYINHKQKRVQLLKFLLQVCEHSHLNLEVTLILSYTYKFESKFVINILDNMDKTADKMPAVNYDEPGGQRENIRWIIAQTYMRISSAMNDNDNKDYPTDLSPAEITSRLDKMLETEKHPLVRPAVIRAFTTHATSNLSDKAVERRVFNTIERLEREELDSVESAMYEVFLSQLDEQRENAPEDDLRPTVPITSADNEYEIQAWKDTTQRPSPLIEKTLTNWVKQSKNERSQQLAFRAFNRFARLNHYIEDFAAESENIPVEEIPVEIEEEKLPFYLRVVVPVLSVFVRNFDLFSTARNLLPEAIDAYEQSPQYTSYMLEQWKKSKDKTLQRMATVIQRIISLKDNGFLLIGGGIFLLLVVGAIFIPDLRIIVGGIVAIFIGLAYYGGKSDG